MNALPAIVSMLLIGSVPVPETPPPDETVSVPETPPEEIESAPEVEIDPAPIESLRFVWTSTGLEDSVILNGPDARLQLVVTGTRNDGELRDLTRQVGYEVAATDVLTVSESGLVAPLADGEATVTATGADGLRLTTTLTVQHFADALPLNFPNQVVPIFTKLTCNSGGCHGKSGGQNGFALSLLGFEPQDDYEHLVHEGRGRRLFPAAPENSLLLLKSINALPHGGGTRLNQDSHDYRTIHRWISQGMPYGEAGDPTVVAIEVLPPPLTMPRDGEQQVRVLAHYSDGSIEDVTHTAQYETNDKTMALVEESGLVKLTGEPGDVSVMVRYQEHASVFRATVPLGAAMDALPEPINFIDEHVFNKLRLLGMPPSPVCDDPTFIRRATLDVAGRLPTPQEATAFLESEDTDKRAKLIDRLVDSHEYADLFANKWSSILRNRRRDCDAFAFHDWIRQSIYENVPFDQFARGIIAASGNPGQHPPVTWYNQVTTPKKQMEDVSQLFLGVRIQCAQCHHHPYEKWSQQDYYGMTAFFSQVRREEGEGGLKRVHHVHGVAAAKNPKTKLHVRPTALGAPTTTMGAEVDPRHALADWMAHPDNPFFARSLVNRYWKHFFNRGLVDPEDDLRVTNPPSNPQLLDALADHFIQSGFDLKDLVRVLCRSASYQFDSQPNDHNANDKQNFSRYYPRRLNAEVLLDAIDTVTGSHGQFEGLPELTRAVQIPTTDARSYFLTLFGRPEGTSACECERRSDANLAQSLHQLNSGEIRNKLTSGRAAALAQDTQRSDEQKVRELYVLAYARVPDEPELSTALEHIGKTPPYERQQAYEDIVWALINTKEFIFNH